MTSSSSDTRPATPDDAGPDDKAGNVSPSTGRQRTGVLCTVAITAVLLLWWTFVFALWQQGWAGIVSVSPWLLGLLFLSVLANFARSSRRWGAVIFFGMLVVPATLVWLYAAGTVAACRDHDWPTVLWDLGAFALALALTLPLSRWLGRQRKDGQGGTLRKRLDFQWGYVQNLIWLPLAWVLVSAVTLVRTQELPVDSDRFSNSARGSTSVEVGAELWGELRIGLALSGGGYRAAIYHAGVLQALEELGIRVDNLSTVSGGSIIGAYYAVGGDPAAFVDAVAAGGFDLRRRLLSIHNALRLPFPGRLAGTEIELLPVWKFDRLDVQRGLLRRALFSGIGSDESAGDRPHLMIAVTDLTYGFQIGLLPDGILVLGEGTGARDVYRGAAFEADRELDLAERVTISGAFPGAFPPRSWRVRVDSPRGTGRGWRNLLLVDGGARDNLGLELLRVADAKADLTGDAKNRNHRMPAHWNLDALISSDGGSIFGVLETPRNALSQLSRTVEVSNRPFFYPDHRTDDCGQVPDIPLRFSPALHLLPPELQFQLAQDPDQVTELARAKHLRFDPVAYPEPVLRRLIELLPQETAQAEATEHLEAFLTGWASHRTHGKDWSRVLANAPAACRATQRPSTVSSLGKELPLYPGVCDAVALEAVLRTSLDADLEVFRATPTLSDRLPRATADALGRLGKTLVFLNWPRIELYLEAARRCASGSGAITAATDTPPPPS